jgi:hypothetical protein
VTCDTISGHFVTDIGENADIGGGNNPDGHQDAGPSVALSRCCRERGCGSYFGKLRWKDHILF